MIRIWGIINNMKKVFYLFPLVLVFLFSCSEIKKSPMTKVKEDNYPSFNLPDLEGNYINLKDYSNSFVLINFWATWCAPCVKEIPSLNNLNEHFKETSNFKMIAINIGQNKGVIEKFFIDKSLSIDFPVLLDENMELSDWNIQAIPTTFLIDGSGKIIYKIEGEKEWDSSEFTSFFKTIIN
jgi:thiol-disulfide isomerase/thioredoxin